MLIVAGVLVIGPGGGSQSAYAATPPVLPYTTTAIAPGGPVLDRIAAAADHQLPPLLRTGPYRYVRTEGWALNSAVSGGHVTSALESHQSEAWRLPGGRGRIRATTGESLVDRVGSRRTLAVLAKPAKQTIILGQGDYQLEPLLNLATLPYQDPSAFAMAVQRDTNARIPAGAHLGEAIAALFQEQPIPSADRAKVWRLLATIPGVTYRGQLADRIGRPGMAITLDDDATAFGLPGRYLYIIDPATGQLLEYDDILTTDPGKLNVRVPAILGLTVYIDAGYTATTTSRPTD